MKFKHNSISEFTTFKIGGPANHFAVCDTIEELQILVDIEFQKVNKFFRAHKLSLHPDKTKYMFLSGNPSRVQLENFTIHVNNNNDNSQANIFKIDRIESGDKGFIKFLGVLVDPNLSFKHQIQSILIKVSRSLFIIRRAKKILPPKALKTLYS